MGLGAIFSSPLVRCRAAVGRNRAGSSKTSEGRVPRPAARQSRPTAPLVGHGSWIVASQRHHALQNCVRQRALKLDSPEGRGGRPSRVVRRTSSARRSERNRQYPSSGRCRRLSKTDAQSTAAPFEVSGRQGGERGGERGRIEASNAPQLRRPTTGDRLHAIGALPTLTSKAQEGWLPVDGNTFKARMFRVQDNEARQGRQQALPGRSEPANRGRLARRMRSTSQADERKDKSDRHQQEAKMKTKAQPQGQAKARREAAAQRERERAESKGRRKKPGLKKKHHEETSPSILTCCCRCCCCPQKKGSGRCWPGQTRKSWTCCCCWRPCRSRQQRTEGKTKKRRPLLD